MIYNIRNYIIYLVFLEYRVISQMSASNNLLQYYVQFQIS